MTILQVHNFYQQPGGEDEIFRAEHALLTGRGHTVFEYVVHNDAINDMSPLSAGLKTIWNADTSRGIREMIQRQRPDIFMRTTPFLSSRPRFITQRRLSGFRLFRPCTITACYAPEETFFATVKSANAAWARLFPPQPCGIAVTAKALLRQGPLELCWLLIVWQGRGETEFKPILR